jgi:L-malate glycosyltransferase
MKILILCLSAGHGGLELYALREIKALLARGHTCLPVVAPGSRLAALLDEAHIPHQRLRVRFYRFPWLAAKTLAALIDQQQIEVLHLHWGNDLYLAALAKTLARRPPRLVYTRQMAITRSKDDILHRWFYRQLDKVLVISQLLAQQAQGFFPIATERIKVLYYGVPPAGSAPPDCSSLFPPGKFAQRRLNVAVFGRVEHAKGQHVMLEAIAPLITAGHDISLSLIGHVMDQQYHAQLQRDVSAAGIEMHVRFTDFVNNAQELMRCFDVIALTTYCETFGLVLIEAMRAGVMVIGTDAGGVPEIIEHDRSGLLVKPGDAAELRATLDALYADPARLQRLAAAGKQRADKLFAQENHYAQLEAELA